MNDRAENDRAGQRFPRLGVPRAQRLVEVAALSVAPAAAVALLVAERVGSAAAAAAFLAAIVTGHLVARSAYADHLLALARVGLRAWAPVAGGVAASLISLAGGHGPAIADVAVAVLGGWIVLLLGVWVKKRFDTERPVRVAVLSAGLSAALESEFRDARIRGYDVVGWIAADAQAFPHQIPGGPQCLGVLEDVRLLVQANRIDLLVSCPVHGGKDARLQTLEIVADNCLDLPVRMQELSQLYEDLLGHVPLGAADAAWFQYLLNPKFRPGSALAKRVLDVAIAAPALVLSGPVLALAALAVKLQDGGPVLYRQQRIGRAGKEFTMLKLRSMQAGADAENGPQWTGERDERVTRVGRILRRLHVDEFPQLWNVLRGEMAIVGPRPEQPELASGLEERFRYYKCRYLLKPGVTGWAQVRCGYAGTEMGSAFKLCHDLFYLKHRSTLSDLLIMVETARMLAGGAQHGVRRADDSLIADRNDPMIESDAATQSV